MNFLMKKFIADNENLRDQNVREAYGVFASIIGIICNIILFVVKLIIGILLKNIAIMADSFNNLSDSATSVVTFIGFRMANKPADEEHPFGHGRIEYISSFIVAFFIMLMGYEFLKSSFGKVINPTLPEPINYITVFILILTILIKLWMASFNKKIGTKINSKALHATAQDARNDVLITAFTIISLFIAEFTGFAVDGYAGFIVAIVLMRSGFYIAKDTLSPLLGEGTNPELAEKIKDFVGSHEGVVGSHDLIMHNYGPNISMGSIHVEVPTDVDVERSHEIIDLIEREMMNKFGVHMVIHMDPVAINDKQVSTLSLKVKNIILDSDPRMNAHDFRMVRGVHKSNFIFDLIVPHEYNAEQRRDIVYRLQKAIKEIDNHYNCVINVENGYTGRWQHEK